MLRIEPEKEPDGFDAAVRQPGLQWISQQSWSIHDIAPEKTKFPEHWRQCKDELRAVFAGQCCFSGSYMRESEVIPIEHFFPKHHYPYLAYEWENYRYCMSRINSRKGIKLVLDPFDIPAGVCLFILDFVTGDISVNSAVEAKFPVLWQAAIFTISKDGLDLNDGLFCNERMEIWDDYLASSRQLPEQMQLKKANSFVWSEAVRQDLL